MEKTNLARELDQKLSLLEKTFFTELKRIAALRLKLEQESVSSTQNKKFTKNFIPKDRKVRSDAKTFTVRLESSLGEKLAKSRGTADELEDKLQEARIAFEDKLQTVERIKKELDRREHLLIQSIREIEAYLRAIFYLKQEADDMYIQLKKVSRKQEKMLKDMSRYTNFKERREYVLKLKSELQPTKLYLENVVSDSPRYSSVKDLIEYYLVLKELQRDLLRQEAECSEAEEKLANERLQLAEFKRRIPLVQVSKESAILELKSQLQKTRFEISQLDEQIDLAIFSKVKDDAVWYDIQRWIKKIFADIKPPEETVESTILDMLDGIKTFVTDAQEMIDRLKKAKRD